MDRLRQRLAQAEEHLFGIKHQQPTTTTTCPTIQNVLDPALTTPLTVLAYAVAAKYILDVLILVLPFALAFGSRIFSSLSRHRLRPLLRPFILIVLLSALLYLILPSINIFIPSLAHARHHLANIITFVVYGFDGGYSEDASFYCRSSFDNHDFYRVFMKLPYFALGLGAPDEPCLHADGWNVVLAPAAYLLSCDAPTMLGRASLLVKLTTRMAFTRVLLHCAASRLFISSGFDELKAAGTSAFTLVESSVVQAASSAHNAFKMAGIFILTSARANETYTICITLALVLCLVLILRLQYTNGALNYMIDAVDSANEELFSNILTRDELADLLSGHGSLSTSQRAALRTLVSDIAHSPSDAEVQFASSDLRDAETRVQVRGLELSSASPDETISAYVALIRSLQAELASSKAERASLAASLRAEKRVGAKSRGTIRSLRHAAARAVHERDEARANADLNALRADELAMQKCDLETMAMLDRIDAGILAERIEELEEEAEWAQFEKDVMAIPISAPPVAFASSPSPPRIVIPGSMTPPSSVDPLVEPSSEIISAEYVQDSTEIDTGSFSSTEITHSPDTTSLFGSPIPLPSRTAVSAPESPAPRRSSPVSLFESPLPYLPRTPVRSNIPTGPFTLTPGPSGRRVLTGVDPRTPACVFKGRAKSHVTDSTRKALAGKENLPPSSI